MWELMNEYSDATIAIGGAIVGSLLTYRVSISVVKRQNFHRSAAAFRAEFVNEIIKLREAREDVCSIITPAVIERQKKAKVCFEYCFSKEKRKKFDKAWEQYENRHVRTTSPGSTANRPIECEKEEKRINKLLSFAEI